MARKEEKQLMKIAFKLEGDAAFETYDSILDRLGGATLDLGDGVWTIVYTGYAERSTPTALRLCDVVVVADARSGAMKWYSFMAKRWRDLADKWEGITALATAYHLYTDRGDLVVV